MSKKKFENDAVFLDQIPEFENVETIKLEKDYLKVIYTNLFFTFTVVSIILIKNDIMPHWYWLRWGEQDSNLRRRSHQIYSLTSLTA